MHRDLPCKSLLMITYREDKGMMVKARNRDAGDEALHQAVPRVLLEQVLQLGLATSSGYKFETILGYTTFLYNNFLKNTMMQMGFVIVFQC